MTRAIHVFAGVGLIVTVWIWMIGSINMLGWPSWFVAAAVIARLYLACVITASLYREYLK